MSDQTLAMFLKSQIEIEGATNVVAASMEPTGLSLIGSTGKTLIKTAGETFVHTGMNIAPVTVGIETCIVAGKLVNDTFNYAFDDMKGERVIENLGTNVVAGAKRATVVTVGAAVGQTIIPIPVIGALVGSLVFSWWLL